MSERVAQVMLWVDAVDHESRMRAIFGQDAIYKRAWDE